MANRPEERKKLKCSFCNKSQEQVRKLIAGPNVYICDECIEICSEIIQDEFDNELLDTDINLLKPMANNKYYATIIIIGPYATNYDIHVDNKTNTSFQWTQIHYTCNWYACGMGAKA